jgi:hypothetical protein
MRRPPYEYLRALRYELNILPKFDRVQICSPENRDYLLSFLPNLGHKLDDNRAGIATSRYQFQTDGREPCTMLFPRQLSPSAQSGSAGLVH